MSSHHKEYLVPGTSDHQVITTAVVYHTWYAGETNIDYYGGP